MATATKRFVTNKTLKGKYEALKELEKGASNKKVAERYLVPKKTLSTWVKNKQQIFDDFQARNPKSRKARGGNHENLDKAMFQWFLSVKNQKRAYWRCCFLRKGYVLRKGSGVIRLSSVRLLDSSLERAIQCHIQGDFW